MQSKRFLTALAAAVVVAAASAVVASADPWNKKTNLTVKETIEIPGATLPPGEYVVKLVDSQSNRHTVQFLNATEDRVISTVIAIPNRRLEPTGDTEFEWYETPAGQPPALRAWFYPGDNFGQEFAYPEDRATALAQQTTPEVTATTPPNQELAAAQQQRQQQQERDAQMEQQQREAEMARQRQQQERETQLAQQREQQEREAQLAQQRQQQEREAQMAQQRQQQERDAQLAQQRQQQEREAQTMAQQREQPAPRPELPETAGFGALLALIGLGSIGGAAALRKIRRS